jgi:hypothetical protein
MKDILIHFEKLLATIKNNKNNKNHLGLIRRMIHTFENRFVNGRYTQVVLLSTILHRQLDMEINLRSSEA